MGSCEKLEVIWRVLILLHERNSACLGNVGNSSSQVGLGTTATGSIRQRSNYRCFVSRSTDQSYRMSVLVLVVSQSKELTHLLFTDELCQVEPNSKHRIPET